MRHLPLTRQCLPIFIEPAVHAPISNLRTAWHCGLDAANYTQENGDRAQLSARIVFCHDRLRPTQGFCRCSRSGSRRACQEDLGEPAIPGEPFHVESEASPHSALSVILAFAAGVPSVLSAEPCVPASTNLIRNWLISLWAQASPQRCFASEETKWRDFQPLMRNSPDSSEATNQ